MFDDAQRLRDDPRLLILLSHYAVRGSEDRETWRDRLMQMESVESPEISVLHGELIAFDWIEQNTGQAVAGQDGKLSSCYYDGLSNTLEVHVMELRRKLEEHGPRLIHTFRGRGYAFGDMAGQEPI